MESDKDTRFRNAIAKAMEIFAGDLELLRQYDLQLCYLAECLSCGNRFHYPSVPGEEYNNLLFLRCPRCRVINSLVDAEQYERIAIAWMEQEESSCQAATNARRKMHEQSSSGATNTPIRP